MSGGVRAGGFGDAGVVVLRGQVDPLLCEQVRTSLADEFTGAVGGTGRLSDAWRFHPPVRELACEPSVLAVLGELFGRRPIPFQTLNFDRGSQQRLHADSIHFDSVPSGLMCGVWVALEDVGAEQGPVVFAPGSHLVPVVRPEESLDARGVFDYQRYEDLVARRSDRLHVEQFEASVGDILIWDANLLHGGASITDPDSSRWSQVTHYFFEGCSYITPMHSDVVGGEYRLREPLVDVSTGRKVTHSIDGRRARLVRLSNGRTRILGDEDPAPPPAMRLISTARGCAVRARRRAAVAGSRASWLARQVPQIRRMPVRPARRRSRSAR